MDQTFAILDCFVQSNQEIANASCRVQEIAGALCGHTEQIGQHTHNLLDNLPENPENCEDSSKSPPELICGAAADSQTLCEPFNRNCEIVQLLAGSGWEYVPEGIFDR